MGNLCAGNERDIKRNQQKPTVQYSLDINKNQVVLKQGDVFNEESDIILNFGPSSNNPNVSLVLSKAGKALPNWPGRLACQVYYSHSPTYLERKEIGSGSAGRSLTIPEFPRQMEDIPDDITSEAILTGLMEQQKKFWSTDEKNEQALTNIVIVSTDASILEKYRGEHTRMLQRKSSSFQSNRDHSSSEVTQADTSQAPLTNRQNQQFEQDKHSVSGQKEDSIESKYGTSSSVSLSAVSSDQTQSQGTKSEQTAEVDINIRTDLSAEQNPGFVSSLPDPIPSQSTLNEDISKQNNKPQQHATDLISVIAGQIQNTQKQEIQEQNTQAEINNQNEVKQYSHQAPVNATVEHKQEIVPQYQKEEVVQVQENTIVSVTFDEPIVENQIQENQQHGVVSTSNDQQSTKEESVVTNEVENNKPEEVEVQGASNEQEDRSNVNQLSSALHQAVIQNDNNLVENVVVNEDIHSGAVENQEAAQENQPALENQDVPVEIQQVVENLEVVLENQPVVVNQEAPLENQPLGANEEVIVQSNTIVSVQFDEENQVEAVENQEQKVQVLNQVEAEPVAVVNLEQQIKAVQQHHDLPENNKNSQEEEEQKQVEQTVVAQVVVQETSQNKEQEGQAQENAPEAEKVVEEPKVSEEPKQELPSETEKIAEEQKNVQEPVQEKPVEQETAIVEEPKVVEEVQQEDAPEPANVVEEPKIIEEPKQEIVPEPVNVVEEAKNIEEPKQETVPEPENVVEAPKIIEEPKQENQAEPEPVVEENQIVDEPKQEIPVESEKQAEQINVVEQTENKVVEEQKEEPVSQAVENAPVETVPQEIIKEEQIKLQEAPVAQVPEVITQESKEPEVKETVNTEEKTENQIDEAPKEVQSETAPKKQEEIKESATEEQKDQNNDEGQTEADQAEETNNSSTSATKTGDDKKKNKNKKKQK